VVAVRKDLIGYALEEMVGHEGSAPSIALRVKNLVFSELGIELRGTELQHPPERFLSQGSYLYPNPLAKQA
jgi:hypothetical protein